MTFAFIERQAALPFCDPAREPVAIANPLSEKFAVLRPSLLPGLIDACAHNRRRGRTTSGCSRPAAASRRPAKARAVAVVWCGAARAAALVGAGARGRLLRRQGRRRAAVRGARRRRVDVRAVATRRISCAGRAADVRCGDGIDARRRRPARAGDRSRRAGFPPAKSIYVAEIDLDALAGAAAGRRPARRVAAALPVDRARHLDARR